jgi:hypothetical protein
VGEGQLAGLVAVSSGPAAGNFRPHPQALQQAVYINPPKNGLDQNEKLGEESKSLLSVFQFPCKQRQNSLAFHHPSIRLQSRQERFVD